MTEEFGQMARYFEDTEQGAGVGLVPPTTVILPPPTVEDCRLDGRLDKTQSNPRHFDQFPRLRCAAAITNYHSTFGDVDDRPGTHLSIVLVNQGSIGARLLCVFARRARRANRAQSTAQH